MTLPRYLVIGLVLLGGVWQALAQTNLPAAKPAPASFRVRLSPGATNVFVQRAGANAVDPAYDGQILRAGDRILTGAGGRGILIFSDGLRIQVRELSDIQISPSFNRASKPVWPSLFKPGPRERVVFPAGTQGAPPPPPAVLQRYFLRSVCDTNAFVPVRIEAALGIIGSGEPDPETIKTIAEVLSREQDVSVIVSLLRVLGSLEDIAGFALPEIRKLQQHSSFQVRLIAALAVDQIAKSRPGQKGVSNGRVIGQCVITQPKPLRNSSANSPVEIEQIISSVTTVYFLGTNSVFRAVPDRRGKFQLRLPVGRYEYSWLYPNANASSFGNPFNLGHDGNSAKDFVRSIEVGKGRTVDLGLRVLVKSP